MFTNSTSSDKLVGDVKKVVHDAEDFLKEIADEAGDKAVAARARLSSAVQTARQSCERLQEKAKAGVQTADEAVRQHPYQSLGIAAGVGLLLGFLLGRKS